MEIKFTEGWKVYTLNCDVAVNLSAFSLRSASETDNRFYFSSIL